MSDLRALLYGAFEAGSKFATEHPKAGPSADTWFDLDHELAFNKFLRDAAHKMELEVLVEQGYTVGQIGDETRVGQKCSACGTPYDTCTDMILVQRSTPCCRECAFTPTHGERTVKKE